jgi:trehalose 6-phosphate synthase/phosphatase
MDKKLTIVSNRLPFTLKNVEGKIEAVQSSGGLVSAIRSMSGDQSIMWIGAADFSEEDWKEYAGSSCKNEFEIVPLFLDRHTEELYYNGFSNSMLWPLFHYFPTFAEYNEEHYAAYREVNRIFAEAIVQNSNGNELVWVHDYHLMLVPGFLKENGNNINCSFFLHIPFPSFELIKLIPEEWRNEMLRSLLNADVVGFHTPDYCHHFKNSLSYFLGVECSVNCTSQDGHITLIKDYPISIDFKKFNSSYDNPDVKKERKKLRERYKNLKIIFSLDRLDYSKGVMNRLQGFESLLESNADIEENVVFIINVIPSRENILQYAERRRLIEENVSRINGIYGTLQWQPIIYQYRSLNFTQLMACYTSSDVLLVTPLRDGMNLVAKEFVACRKDLRGVLVLSEFAGAASELTDALFVNPNDVQQMREVMMQAIELPEKEQEEKMSRMQEVIKKNDVNKWMNSFLHDALSGDRGQIQANVLSYFDEEQIMRAYTRAKKRLILLDYDGTLIPFYNKPEEAVPGEMIKKLIKKLSTAAGNSVMLISGRDSETLHNWFDNFRIGIAAEHGVLYRECGEKGWRSPDNIDLGWMKGVKHYLQDYIEHYPGSFIEEKKFAFAWHYRAVENIDEKEVRIKFSKDLMALNLNSDFHILHGNKVIEIKSSYMNKGSFVKNYIFGKDFDFVLAIGDDITDEDMFNTLTEQHHITIKVGHGKTAARFNIFGVNQVINFLEHICQEELITN